MNSYPPQTHQVGNISYAVNISLSEAATGKTQSLIVLREDVCEVCSGTGQSWRSDDGTCSKCNNNGFVKYEKEFKVRIPAGIETGSKLRITGEGNLGAVQAARGNLEIEINVSLHELFERKGKDLHFFFSLTEDELKGTSEITVPTLLDGEKRLRIPPQTNLGTVFRLTGFGLPSMAGGERGDLFVKVGKKTIEHDSDNTRGSSVVTPSSTSWREFFRNHLKAVVTAVVVLLLAGPLIYFSIRQSSKRISPSSNNANTSLPPVSKTTILTPPLIPTATPPIQPPFSLPNGANITRPQGPIGNGKMIIINNADGDIALKVVSSASEQTRRFVYVRSGSKVVISNLRREVYLLRWESGMDWDVNSRRFLYRRSIHQFAQTFDLRRTIWTVDFTPSPKGELVEVPLDESDFEDK